MVAAAVAVPAGTSSAGCATRAEAAAAAHVLARGLVAVPLGPGTSGLGELEKKHGLNFCNFHEWLGRTEHCLQAVVAAAAAAGVVNIVQDAVALSDLERG